MKKIHFQPNVAAEVRLIDKPSGRRILQAIHRYAESGEGQVKPLSGEFEGLTRLRIGDHRVLFDETESTITIHRIKNRRDAYR
jgi:mRNA-degrading endonuclease RelE of RelBE toxin-antitoxin system